MAHFSVSQIWIIICNVVVCMRNVPHGPMHLTTWCPVGDAVWRGEGTFRLWSLATGNVCGIWFWDFYSQDPLPVLSTSCAWMKCELSASWLSGQSNSSHHMLPATMDFRTREKEAKISLTCILSGGLIIKQKSIWHINHP